MVLNCVVDVSIKELPEGFLNIQHPKKTKFEKQRLLFQSDETSLDEIFNWLKTIEKVY